MQGSLVEWLNSVASLAFTASAWAFVAVNGVAAAIVLVTRDRGLVNRWTSMILAVNLALVGTGVGIPLAAIGARAAIVTMAPAFRIFSPPQRDVEPPADDRAATDR